MIRVITFIVLLGMGWSHLQAQTIITLDSIQDVSCPINSDGGVFITAVGVPPLTYQWSTGATTQNLTNVISGSYRVTITDGNSAAVVSNLFTVGAPAVLNVNTDSITNILCGGDSTGAVDISVLGGTAPYTYLWQDGSTNQDISGLGAGSAFLTVTDANGCVASPKSILILEPLAITATLDSLQNILCNGDNNGQIDISSVGGTGTLSFLWSNGATTEDLTGLGAGIYTLTITDSNSCQLVMGPYTISEPAVLTVVVDSFTNIACNGANTGAVYITATGGVGPYTYFWTQGFGGEDFLSINAGTYQVTVTDANNCTVSSSAQIISEPVALSIDSTSIQNISCNGDLDGSIDLVLSGGVGPYTFLWNNGATDLDIDSLTAGSYSLTITDANACVLISPTYTIVEPALLTFTLDSFYNVSCNGLGDGALFTSTAGGTMPYTYLWSNGDTLGTITRLNGGGYSVTVTDSSGCVLNAGPFIVREPAVLTVVLDSLNDLTCNSDSSGFINVSVGGGNVPFSYNWSNGATTQDLSNLSVGSYSLTVTDSSGCVVNLGPLAVIEPAVLAIQLDTFGGISCNGAADGRLLVTPSGGIGPYTYLWSNSATTQDITNLPAGNYQLTLTDANGCTFAGPLLTLIDPVALTINLDSLYDVSCNGLGDGAIFSTPLGGTAPYSYVWDNGDTLPNITRLNGGTYTATVTDDNGCVLVFGPITVREPAPLTAVVDSINAIACNGDSIGFINISVAGGNFPFSYNWSNGDTTQDLTNLQAGSYSLTVTDSSSCVVNLGPLVVTEPAVFSIDTAIVQDLICNGNANGSITLTLSGGTAPYTYNWSNSATTRDLTGLSGGTYSVTITDDNGCALISPIYTITEPTALLLTIDSVNNVRCNGENGGAIFTSITGGTAPYRFAWSTGDTTTFIDSLSAGSYDVLVTDANGCVIAIIGTVITEPAPLTILLDSIRPETCAGNSNDGLLDIQALGGTGPYNYVWTDTAQTSPIALGDSFVTSAGIYRAVVLDANGCFVAQNFTITALSDIQVNLDSLINPTCASNNDGAIYLTTSNGVGNYTYNWNNGAATEDIINLGTSIWTAYIVTVTDSLGCQVVKTYALTAPAPVVITIDNSNDVTCKDDQDGNVSVSLSGNTAFYTYSWSNSATTQNLSNVAGGTYRLTVTDTQNGCTYVSDSVVIEEPDSLLINLASITPETCADSSQDGSITVAVTGGTAPYTYNWVGSASATNVVNNAPAGIKNLLVVDANGCFTSENYTIVALSDLSIALDSFRTITCNGGSDGYLQVSASGGVGTYSYNWSNGATTSAIDSLTIVMDTIGYIITVTDSLGCQLTEQYNFLPPAPITITETITRVDCDSTSNGSISIVANGPASPFQYLWSDGNTSSLNNGLSPGTYTLTVTNALGCTQADTFLLEQRSLPVINPFIGQLGTKDTTADWGSTVVLYAGSDERAQGVTYNWQNLGLVDNPNIDDLNNPSTTTTPEPSTSGRYQFFLTATSVDGCVDTGSVYLDVEVKEFLGMPTAFTPNGDGINDYYRPANIDPQFVQIFRIYNRWGQLIYDGTDLDNQWDGTFQGQEQPVEVYIYYIEYQEPSKEGRQFRGEFTLLR